MAVSQFPNATERATQRQFVRGSPLPRWVRIINRVVLHGEPSRSAKAETIRLWHAHFDDVAASGAKRSTLAAEVVASAVAHVWHRMQHGEPTLVSPGLTLMAVGIASCGLSLSPAFGPREIYIGFGILAVGGLIALSAEHDAARTRIVSFEVWLTAGLAVAIMGIAYWLQPIQPGDRLVPLGAAACTLSLWLRGFRGTQVSASLLASFGLGVVATSNYILANATSDRPTATTALALFILEGLAALGFLRKARAASRGAG